MYYKSSSYTSVSNDMSDRNSYFLINCFVIESRELLKQSDRIHGATVGV